MMVNVKTVIIVQTGPISALWTSAFARVTPVCVGKKIGCRAHENPCLPKARVGFVDRQKSAVFRNKH